MGLECFCQITRIENAHLYGQYALKREQMNEANGPSVVNERLLWHGTVPSTVSVICNRGFNRSYCGKNGTVLLLGRITAIASDSSLLLHMECIVGQSVFLSVCWSHL